MVFLKIFLAPIKNSSISHSMNYNSWITFDKNMMKIKMTKEFQIFIKRHDSEWNWRTHKVMSENWSNQIEIDIRNFFIFLKNEFSIPIPNFFFEIWKCLLISKSFRKLKKSKTLKLSLIFFLEIFEDFPEFLKSFGNF